jgi:hypothetical protein
MRVFQALLARDVKYAQMGERLLLDATEGA